MLSNKQKEKLFDLADAIHRRFFGVNMSVELKSFVGNLSWSFFGGGLSAGTLFSTFLFLGWALGPASYGQFTLVYAGVLFTTSFIVFGFDSGYIKFASHLNLQHQQKALLLRLFLISGCAALLVAVFFWKTQYLQWTYILTVALFVIKAFADAFVRQQQQFNIQQKARLLEGTVLVIVLATLFLLEKLVLETAILAYALGALGFVGAVLGQSVGNNEKTEVALVGVDWGSKKWLIIEYSALLYINGLVGFFYSYGDKFLLNRYVDSVTLGSYSAYYTVSVMLVSQVALLFINVFFPVITQKGQSKNMTLQLEKILLRVFFWLFIPLTVWIYVVIGMLGKEYDQSVLLSLSFALLTYVNTFFILLWWQIAATGNEGVRFMIQTGIVSVCIFLSVFFIGVGYAPIYTLLLSLSLALIFNIMKGRRFLQTHT